MNGLANGAYGILEEGAVNGLQAGLDNGLANGLVNSENSQINWQNIGLGYFVPRDNGLIYFKY